MESKSPVTVECMVCRAVLVDAGPGAPVSHGLGPCCWDSYRASEGLPVKPYPVSK